MFYGNNKVLQPCGGASSLLSLPLVEACTEPPQSALWTGPHFGYKGFNRPFLLLVYQKKKLITFWQGNALVHKRSRVGI